MFSRNKIDKDNFYLSIVLVGLLFFIFGFSLAVVIKPFESGKQPTDGVVNTNLPERQQEPANGEQNIEKDKNQDPRRSNSFLYGEVIKAPGPTTTATMTVNADLTSLFPNPSQQEVQLEFKLEEGTTKAYQGPRVGKGERIGFGMIAPGEEVAVICDCDMEDPESYVEQAPHTAVEVYRLKQDLPEDQGVNEDQEESEN